MQIKKITYETMYNYGEYNEEPGPLLIPKFSYKS